MRMVKIRTAGFRMIGMILCGGYGKRFYPLTQKVPKLLLEIKDDYTILDRQLFAYKSAGFERVILLTGYLSKRIEERYRSRYKELDIEYAVEKEPLGTLNAIRLGMKVAGDDVFVSNGDVVADINIKRMVQEFNAAEFLASMFVMRMRSPYGIVMLGDRHIESFKEKPVLRLLHQRWILLPFKKVLPST